MTIVVSEADCWVSPREQLEAIATPADLSLADDLRDRLDALGHHEFSERRALLLDLVVNVIARHAATARLEGALAMREAVREAMTTGYPRPSFKSDQCEHGQLGLEDCIACYDDYLESVLANAIRSTDPISGEGGE